MNITEFIAFLKANKIKYRKRGDDICVDNVIYQFGCDGELFGKVLPYNQEYIEII
jgi:hypothetical protein